MGLKFGRPLLVNSDEGVQAHPQRTFAASTMYNRNEVQSRAI